MMGVVVRLVDGGTYTVDQMPDTDALDLAAAFREDVDGTITLDMDGATVIVDRRHIAAVEIEQAEIPPV